LNGPRQYLPVQPCKELQEEFMAVDHPHHPHHRYVSPFRVANVSEVRARSLVG
jgi:hypothetical protein